MEQSINIEFPFKDDNNRGNFISMNKDPKTAIKSDLLHLLLTNRGERLYMPDFGANLKKYLFEQNDQFTMTAIKSEIQSVVSKFIPNLIISELLVERVDNSEHMVKVRIDYVVSNNTLNSSDFIELTI